MNHALYLKILFAVVFMFSAACITQAQVRQEIDIQEWPAGTVTLNTGEVLEGSVTYYREQDIISVLDETGKLHSLSPVNVEQFEVQNEYGSRNHIFKSIFWDQGKEFSDFKKPTFFEQLTDGNTTLLMRESYHKRNIDPNLVESSNGMVHDPMGYPIDVLFADQIKPLYYVLKPDGDVMQLQSVRKDFLKYCGKRAGNIKSFVRKQKLRFDQPMDFTAIVNYYNTLL